MKNQQNRKNANVRIDTKSIFGVPEDEIYGYQWSAILDMHTCNYCASMDGKVIKTKDKAFHKYKPGAVHFGCRCIWVAILKEEVNPPPFTGIPKQLRPQSEVPAWKFKDLESPLIGAGKRKEGYYQALLQRGPKNYDLPRHTGSELR